MNPLSLFTYYRRHKRWALMLTALLAMAVAGLYLVIGLLQETYISPIYTMNGYLTKFSLVQPEMGARMDPAVAARIRASADVTRVIPQNNVEITVPGMGVISFVFRLIGLRESDIAAVLDQSGAALVEGRLPQPGTNGIALSREIAMALDLGIGDTFDRTTDEAAFTGIVSPLEVVGIFSGDVRLGIMSYEYLAGDERYRSLARDGLLIMARPGREAAVNDFLLETARGSQTTAVTYQLLKEKTARDQSVIYIVGIPLVLLVTIAITLVVGAINQLAFMRRLSEFGALLAVGRGKTWLASRLTLETVGLALAGWGLGILLACGAMGALSAAVYAPKGLGFNPLQVTEFMFVMPLPLAVIGFTLFTAVHALGRLDPVAIVERGELSMEGEQAGRAPHSRAGSLPRPLAPITFYRRHTRQAAVLIGAMALMIIGTALFVFLSEIFDHARQPMLNHLGRMSLISPSTLPLEAAMAEEIRTNPAVERVIPAYVFTPLGIAFPPIAPNYPGETYGVAEDDMAYLVELFGLELAEGHLPRPGTNEIVIPWTFTVNRNIRLGDVVGDREHPVFPDAPVLPSDLVVEGIFAAAETYRQEIWLSFVSLEFVEENREEWKGPLSLIVTPRAGQKAALDAWLEDEWDGGNFLVFTHGNQTALFQEQAGGLLMILGLLESILALVAALTLAGLHYIFITQRKAEFGVLHALGFTRRQLVWRSVRETIFTTGAAWLAAVVCFAVIVLGFQRFVYDPAGLQLDFFNPTPRFFTLPVPIAVFAAVAAAAFWMLSRFDPVAIVERRD